MKQRSDEWHASRVGNITGSRIGAILNLSPFAKRDDVMREMVRQHFGLEQEFKGSVATRHGDKHEKTAITEYEIQTGNIVEEIGIIHHPEIEYLAHSPDGLIGLDGEIEVKCPYSGVIKSIKEQPHYNAQIQLGLECAGRDWCDFVVWTPGDMLIERVYRDRMWFKEHENELETFYQEYLKHIQGDGKPYTDDIEKPASAEYLALESEYIKKLAVANRAKESAEQIKAELLSIAKKNGVKTVGALTSYTPYKKAGSVDYSKIPELKGVDLNQYRKKSRNEWRLTIK